MMNTADVLDRNALTPLGVSYGCGVDSTAMLVEMVKRGVRPDFILFADTAAELPATYGYLPVINEFLRSHSFPEVTVVRKRSKYAGLYENCLGNETLPSLAFGKKACSLKWKVDPMNFWTGRFAPAKACWKAGFKVIKAIGYDGGARDKQRFCQSAESEAKRAAAGKGDKKYTYWYPLIEWGIDREACVATIEAAGLRVPIKSACFFCPARKPAEILELKVEHPQLFQLAVKLETTARDGKHGLRSTKGLGRNWAWGERFADAV
jgi:hypothetical protein